MGKRQAGIAKKRLTLPRGFRPGWARSGDLRRAQFRGALQHQGELAADSGGLEELTRTQRDLIDLYSHAYSRATEAMAKGDDEAFLLFGDRVAKWGEKLGYTRRAKRVGYREYIASKTSAPAATSLPAGSSSLPTEVSPPPPGPEGETP